MLSRRQKKALYGFTGALTCTAFLSAFLIFFNISGSVTEEPVVFSDILEGASEINDDSDIPALTMASDVLMETMYSEKYATFTLPDDPFPSASYEQTEPFTFFSYEDTGSDTLSAVSYETAPYSDDPAGIPINPNEITLLSGELEQFRTNGSSGNEGSLLQNETPPRDTGTPVITVFSASHSSRTTTEITAPTLPYSSQVTSSAPTSVISRSDTTTGITTAPTTAGTVTAPSTVSATTRRTTASGASTTAHSTKAPFINVGGGVFSEDDNVYLTMFRLVNNARKAAGLKDLWYSARVSEICKLRAGELSSYYSHTRPDGSRFSSAYTDLGIKYKSCGENIAYGRNMFKTPEEVFKAWMDSPSHRENILNPDFECVAFGLSILKVDNDTYYYWAQEFASLG